MVLSVLGPVTQASLPVAGPGLETHPPSLCWASAEGEQGSPLSRARGKHPEQLALLEW